MATRNLARSHPTKRLQLAQIAAVDLDRPSAASHRLAKRKLAALTRSAESDATEQAGSPMLRLKPGSKLMRAWRGKTHTVLVLDDGFEHHGKRYTSLTQIANALTGTHWSGPRFFGLIMPPQQTRGRKSRDGSE